MKKTVSMFLASIALVSTAHAEFIAVTDSNEIKNIKKAVSMTLETAEITSCQYAGKDGVFKRYPMTYYSNYELFGSEISSANTVYRQDDGQPVLQFVSGFIGGRGMNYVTVTTDSTGTKIVSMLNQQTKKTSDETVNRGTLARPEFVVVPGQWETTVTTSCTFK